MGRFSACLAMVAIRAEGLKVEFFKNDQIEHVLPKPPANYPEPLQGMIWMDQAGYYGFSDIPGGGAPDGALSFGDTENMLDTKNKSLYVNTQGPGWQWFNDADAYKMYASGGVSGYHYLFQFNSDYTHAQIYPYSGHIWVPTALMSFTMDLQQTPQDGTCPPSTGASKEEISKCAKWKRLSKGFFGATGTYTYYAFEIVDKNGNRVQPYYNKYLEWLNQHTKPNASAARAAGLDGFDETKVFAQEGTSMRGAPSLLANSTMMVV